MKKKILMSSPTVTLTESENTKCLYLDGKYKTTLKKSFQILYEKELVNEYFKEGFILYSWDGGMTLEYRNNNICVITGYQAGLTPSLYLIENGGLYAGPYKIFDRVSGGFMKYKVDDLINDSYNLKNRGMLNYVIQPDNPYLIKPLDDLVEGIWNSLAIQMRVRRIRQSYPDLTLGAFIKVIWDLMEEERSPLRNKNDMKKIIEFIPSYRQVVCID